MRLFIAIDIPEEAGEEIRRIQEKLGSDGLKTVSSFHMTHKFLGEVSEERAGWLKEKLKAVRHRAFEARLSGIGVFPNEKYIRVVWVGLEPAGELTSLHKKIDEAIGKEYPDDYKFTPHVTLARVRLIQDKKGFVEMIKKIKVDGKKFRVNEFKLKKSTLTRAGAVYEDVASFRLG